LTERPSEGIESKSNRPNHVHYSTLNGVNAMYEPRERNEKGAFVSSHGLSKTAIYNKWCSMRERCKNPHNKSFSRYGAKGVTVCKEWDESFQAFYEWAMDTGYKAGLTIDRIDNSKGYSPENCRWATTSQQNRNYSRNHLITYNGETKCLADWADEFGINRTTILFRLKSGKPIEKVFDKTDGRSLRWQKNR